MSEYKIEGNFTALTHEMTGSPAFRALAKDPFSVAVLIGIARLMNGDYNGKLKPRRAMILEWMCSGYKDAYTRAMRNLVALGFVRKTGPGMVRVTFYAAGGKPATHEWKEFQTLESALASIQKKPRRPMRPEVKHKIDEGTLRTRKRKAGIGHNGGPKLIISVGSNPDHIAISPDDVGN